MESCVILSYSNAYLPQQESTGEIKKNTEANILTNLRDDMFFVSYCLKVNRYIKSLHSFCIYLV